MGPTDVHMVFGASRESIHEWENTMDENPLELTIQMCDLEELARINPVAWEQLLHIVDNRQNAERIADLEAHLDHAHSSNGVQSNEP